MPAAVAGVLWTVGTSVLATIGVVTSSSALILAVGATVIGFQAYRFLKHSSGLHDPGELERNSNYQVSVRSTQAPRNMVYGQALVGGVIAYANNAGADLRELYMIVVHDGADFLGEFLCL